MTRPAGNPSDRLDKCPAPPRHLSERARVEWRRLGPVAVALGTLTRADLRAFELLVETLATETTAREEVTASGYSVPTGDGGQKPHPAVRIMEEARRQSRALLSDFGLTPKGRGTVKPAPAGDGDGWDELLA